MVALSALPSPVRKTSTNNMCKKAFADVGLLPGGRLAVGKTGAQQQPREFLSGRGPDSRSRALRGAPEGTEVEPTAPTLRNRLEQAWLSLDEEIRESIKDIGVSFFVISCIRTFAAEPRYIPSLSMYPTFDVGDNFVLDKLTPNWNPYKRTDVAVFYPPWIGPDAFRQDEVFIKRIVALEGDTVEMKNRKLYVNGEPQKDPFINEDALYDFEKIVVPKGFVFCLGDNRNNSYDGHIWGALPKENVIGRAAFTYWPPGRAGSIEAKSHL